MRIETGLFQAGIAALVVLFSVGITARRVVGASPGERGETAVAYGQNEYVSQNHLPRGSLANATVSLWVRKEADGLPVTMPLASLDQALRTELHSAGARIVPNSGAASERADLDIEVTLSKYQAQRFPHGTKVFIDGVGTVLEGFTKQEVARVTFSLSGLGADVARAEGELLKRWTGALFRDKQLAGYLAGAQFRSGGSPSTLELDRLTDRLFRNTRKVLDGKPDGRARRIAVGRIVMPDALAQEAELWAERVQASCTTTWDPASFNFYARTRLRDLLEEIGLQQSGALDPETSTKIGMMHGVDYLVLGAVQAGKGGDGVELSVYELSTGSIVAAERGFLTASRQSNGRSDQ